MNEKITIEFQKGDHQFQDIKFLAAALKYDKEDIRDHVNHIKVTPDHAVATDGSRLHYVKDSVTLVSGGYKVVKNLKSIVVLEKVMEVEELSYPSYDDLLEIPTYKEFVIDTRKDVFIGYTSIVRNMDCNTLNYDFVYDVCKTLSFNNDFITVNIPEPNIDSDGIKTTDKPVHFTFGDTYHALIMPCLM